VTAKAGPSSILDVLNAQLELLSDRLRQVLDALVKGDTDRLLAHERFLADRFGQSELDLGQR
jgi:FixJ family two-component response regulator